MKKLVKRVVTSGDCVEEFYCLAGDKTEARAPKKKKYKQDLRQLEANLKTAEKRLARILNCNFTYGDMLITLDYSDEHLRERGELLKDVQLFLRRLKREYARKNIPYKFVRVFGEVSTHTGKTVRPHHHIVMPAVDFEIIRKQWKLGCVNYRLLRDQKDYSTLASYLLKNARKDLPDYKKYSVSRGLKEPVWEEICVDRFPPIQPPKGAIVMKREEYDPFKKRDYVRYISPRNNCTQNQSET